MGGPRVRIAPSPTGFFHVGTARTALFNWFIARQHPDGVFVLRIEDTDTERNREEWVDGIVEAMAWLGMVADEGPYRQSEFAHDHDAALVALRDGGFTYFCDCRTEDVQARKGPSAPPGYDGFCRDRHLVRSATTAERFRVPESAETVVEDVIRGRVVFDHTAIEDFVVARSSGAVLFGLANVVDDRRDRITHVIRGEEHVPNTPKQILLWRALNEVTGVELALPTYAHLPVLVNEQRKKLSKRRDPVALESYRDQGYLHEALMNYLSLLGWSPRDGRELVDVATCVEQFRLSDVSHSPAFFDLKKLAHVNGEYVRGLDADEFLVRARPWVAPWSTPWRPTVAPPWTEDQFDEGTWAQIAPLVQTRITKFDEIGPMIDFLFLADVPMDDESFHKAIAGDEGAADVLRDAIATFQQTPWSAEAIQASVVAVGERHGRNLRKTQAPIRCAVTGRTVGPPLFESLELLGRDEVSRRLADALAR